MVHSCKTIPEMLSLLYEQCRKGVIVINKHNYFSGLIMNNNRFSDMISKWHCEIWECPEGWLGFLQSATRNPQFHLHLYKTLISVEPPSLTSHLLNEKSLYL